MVFDRMLADDQALGDLSVGQARRHQFQHFQFARSQLLFRPEGIHLNLDLLQDPGGHPARDRRLTPRYASELLQKLTRPCILDEIAQRSRLDRLEEGLAVVVHRQHHDRDGRQFQAQPPSRRYAVLAREVDIHQHDVRPKRTRLHQRARGVLGLADDCEVFLIGQERDQPLPEEGVVVNQEESRGRRVRSLVSFVAPG